MCVYIYIYQGFQDVQDKQLMQYRLHTGQNGRCINEIKNSKVRMSRCLVTSSEARMAKIMVQYGRPSRSSRKESVRLPSGRTIMVKAIWENPIEVRLGESFQLVMFNCQPIKRTILIRVCGRYQSGRQDRKHRADLENSHERRWSARTNSFLDHVFFGLHSKRVSK